MQQNQVYTLYKQCIEYMLGDKKQVCGNQYTCIKKFIANYLYLHYIRLANLERKKNLKWTWTEDSSV
jgi:hypothetical protein